MISLLFVEKMDFFTLFWVIFWRQIRGSILSFVKNPLYTASNYTKMSLKNTSAVKDLEIVNTLVKMEKVINNPTQSCPLRLYFTLFSKSNEMEMWDASINFGPPWIELMFISDGGWGDEREGWAVRGEDMRYHLQF